ncbi:STE3-domain-containing protein [Tricholoma matsutake]|nr:STE3-domain-containing protein [Tricholoma matsutake 945]
MLLGALYTTPSMTTSNRIFSAFSFISFVFCCIPLRRYMQAWNIGMSLNMAATGLGCLIYSINSIIWNDNVNNPAPIWCDISSRVQLAASIAAPVAVLCTIRRIYLLTVGYMPLTTNEKRRAVMLDLASGLGIPMIVVILMYIPQLARFAIFEDLGCAAATSDTSVGVAVQFAPQMIIYLASAVYSILTIRTLYNKYSEVSEFLSTNDTVDKSQYVRVIIIVVGSSVFMVPFSIYSLVVNWNNIHPWPGWKNLHSDTSPLLVPASVWRSQDSSKYGVEIARWTWIFNALTIFACFGIHREACRGYVSAAQYVLQFVPCFQVNRTSTDHNPESVATNRMPPLIFACNPTPRKLKFLDFSPNKTRVIADVAGGLPQTYVSTSSMTTNSDFRGTG